MRLSLRIKTMLENYRKTLNISLIQGSQSLLRSIIRVSEKIRSIRVIQRDADESSYVCESGVCFESGV